MKVALISDLHFGIKKSDTTFQKSQLRFFEKQLVEELKMRDVNTIFVLGDVFDTRQAINVMTNNVVLKLFANTFKDFDIHMIVGNHDLYYTDTTEVNSLKQLDLLPNVTVYEKPCTKKFAGHDITFLPWITNYEQAKLPTSEYCFAHLDVTGFMMDRVNMCSNGISVRKLASSFKNVYTGHFHTRSKKRIGACNIEYIGSPYQLTRIDAGQDRGCTILDLDTNETELIVNTVSIKYIKIAYPNVPDNLHELAHNNIVDVDIPYELSDESANIVNYMQQITAANAVTVTQVIGKKPDLTIEHDEDLSNIDLFSLFKSYTDQLKADNKEEIYTELIDLYNTFKRRIVKWNRKQLRLKMVKLKAFTNTLCSSCSKKASLLNIHI